MSPKKARFINRGCKGSKGKGKAGRHDDRGYRDDDRSYGPRSDWGYDQYGDWGGRLDGSSWDYGGRDDQWGALWLLGTIFVQSTGP